MATPAQVDVWSGLDAGKGEHFADVHGCDAMLRTRRPCQPARRAAELAEVA